MSLSVCRLYCGDDIGTIWPIPTNRRDFVRGAEKINPQQISFDTENFKTNSELWDMASSRFLEMQLKKIPEKYPLTPGGKSIKISITAESEDLTLDYDTDESYQLNLDARFGSEVFVTISAKNFYGVRHALETLSQLIVHDDLNHEMKIIQYADIHDTPAFKHRGISMDTSRNFYPVDVIKRTLNGLAMDKMNSFHWHITDSQSFPMVIKSHPDFTRYGAYSPKKVYTAEDIKDIVKFGKSRGVKVIPEFDQPTHIGHG